MNSAEGCGRCAVKIAVWGLVALLWCQPVTASDKTLERQLAKHAPLILERLREQGIKNVGVLKFRTVEPEQRPTDNAGTFNSLLAQRVEAALFVKLPHDSEMKIVRDASSVAATLPGASHLQPDGRARLFSAKYPVAWGDESVGVDAFVTGVAQFARDYKSFRLGILKVQPDSRGLEVIVPPFDCDVDGSILHEIGESFQLRGVPEDSEAQDPAELARQVRQDTESHFPLHHEPSVMLRISYDGQPIDVEVRDGEAWIPEPREGQSVTFELERLDAGEDALGCVLKANGENTLYRERGPDFHCSKWVLTEARAPTKIFGFETRDNQTAERFRVASREESQKLEMYYGPDCGTISLLVFREATPETPHELAEHSLDLLDEEAPDVMAIASAAFPDEPPANPGALKAQLRRSLGGEKTRGVITTGETVNHRVVRQDYRWAPEPVLSAVIRYYRASLD